MNRAVAKAILAVVVSVGTVMVLAAPAEAQRHRPRHRQECLAPNGVDDTAALQSELERCSGARSRCTVTLCAGVFRTAPVRVGDFRGVLRGAGRERTVIEALPHLAVNDNPLGYWRDDPLEGAPWPYLVQLIEGRAQISDLAIVVPSPAAGERPTSGWSGGWSWSEEVAGGLLLTGKEAVDFDVRRVRVSGGPDPNSDRGVALLAGVHFQGLLYNPDDDPGGYPVHPVTGRFRISESELVGMESGTPLWEIADARVTVSGNHYHSMVGMDVLDAARSRVVVFGNTWEVEAVGFEAVLNIDGAPSEKNEFFVSRNRGSIGTMVSFASGIFFWDPGDLLGQAQGSTVTLSRNRLTVGVEGNPAYSGIEAWGAERLLVSRNTLRGWVQSGVVAEDTTGCIIFGNNLGALDVGAGPDVLLGSETVECLAIVGRDDVVVDNGTDNRVIRW